MFRSSCRARGHQRSCNTLLDTLMLVQYPPRYSYFCRNCSPCPWACGSRSHLCARCGRSVAHGECCVFGTMEVANTTCTFFITSSVAQVRPSQRLTCEEEGRIL